MAQKAAPFLEIRQLDPAEVAPGDAGKVVVMGQPLVHERVVGVQELQHTSVLADVVVEKEPGLLFHGLAKVVAVLQVDVVLQEPVVQFAELQPLTGEVFHERLAGSGAVQHAPDLLAKDRRFGEPVRPGLVEKRLVRNAAPQEEGEPGRDLQVAQRIGTPPVVGFE